MFVIRISLASNPLTASLNVKVYVIVPVAVVALTLSVIVHAGAVVSKLYVTLVDAILTFPALSVCLTLYVWLPAVALNEVPAPAVQEPPSTLYSQVAPNSNPVTFTFAILVIPSEFELPESVARAKLGVATVWSTVIALAIFPTELTFPAVSVCFTWIVFAEYEASLKVKLVPLPVFQVDPLSVLYCQVAPLSNPVTFTTPLFVIPSEFELPESVARAKLGVATVWSTVIALAIFPTELTFPAVSVCFTWIVFAEYEASLKVKLVPLPVFQVDPLSVLYCQVAPLSNPVTFTTPLFVIPSEFELPESVARAKLGVAIDVSTVKLKAGPWGDVYPFTSTYA